MTELEKAISLLVFAHEGQKDKLGKEYVLHPLRVMINLKEQKEKVVGLLHDIIEDTHMTFEDLERRGFDDEVIAALKLLTHVDDEPYMDYVKRINENKIAREVKIQDLFDNTSPERVEEFIKINPDKVRNMLTNKYKPALEYFFDLYGEEKIKYRIEYIDKILK
ncbi:MAG TPA: hypothetical protein DEP72_01915 [Clostridiales bacterium]|nr:MAG: hypothetical protein A2Y18_01690 [Clostridiales bacterium GWD2_32_19]HCC06911.1 hypothetical protein [Clostridiales bacterium]